MLSPDPLRAFEARFDALVDASVARVRRARAYVFARAFAFIAAHIVSTQTNVVSTEQPSAPLSAPLSAPSSALYAHTAHAHVPQHATLVQRALRAAKHANAPQWRQRLARFNEALGVWVTKNTGTMACAYIFLGIGIGSLVGIATNNATLAAVFGSVSSYVLQLVLLPIINFGTNLLSQHNEIQAEQTYQTTQGTYHHLTQVAEHLVAQDVELLKQTQLLLALVQHVLPADAASRATSLDTSRDTSRDTPPDDDDTPPPAMSAPVRARRRRRASPTGIDESRAA